MELAGRHIVGKRPIERYFIMNDKLPNDDSRKHIVIHCPLGIRMLARILANSSSLVDVSPGNRPRYCMYVS